MQVLTKSYHEKAGELELKRKQLKLMKDREKIIKGTLANLKSELIDQ